MGSPLVLKLPNADKESDGPILLRIEQPNEQRLDLQLFATDGESVFVGKIRHSTVEKLKNTSFGGSLEEWQTILFATLSQQAKALASPVAEHIELAASVSDNLVIVIRRNVDGITVSCATKRSGLASLSADKDIATPWWDHAEAEG